MYKLTATSISLLEDCPRCFWLLHNRGIKRPEGIFPSLPSGMDRILKAHFDHFASSGILPPELMELRATLKPFTDKALLDAWRSNFKGISYTDSNGNILKGAVDNILLCGSKLIVLDYKTRGYPLKDDTASHYQTQMNVYNYLLRKNGYDTEDYAYLLFYHPMQVLSTGEVVFNKDLVKISTSTKAAEKLWKKALKVLSGPEPKSKDCVWCSYKEKS